MEGSGSKLVLLENFINDLSPPSIKLFHKVRDMCCYILARSDNLLPSNGLMFSNGKRRHIVSSTYIQLNKHLISPWKKGSEEGLFPTPSASPNL